LGHQTLTVPSWPPVTRSRPSGDTVIPYRVKFENLGPGTIPTPTQPATAPAQRVEIIDQLSADPDWSTLSFSEFGWGDTALTVPVGRQYHFAVVPMTFNGQVFNVEVEMSFDPAAGVVSVVFQSLDPETSLPPDVLTGFLPPEEARGAGRVTSLSKSLRKGDWLRALSCETSR
jgi:hypothetical protein